MNTEKGPFDITYNFYDYTTGIINYSGTAIGDSLDLKVFRHEGRLKAWLKQNSSFQTIQIDITSSTTNINPTFYPGKEKPTQGVSAEINIHPISIYHTGRKPSPGEIGAANINHNHSWDNIEGSPIFKMSGSASPPGNS